MAIGSSLYFMAGFPALGFELWKSDGTAAGTVLVKDIIPGTQSGYVQYLTEIGGTLLFWAADEEGIGWELWRSDGTEAGTVFLEHIADDSIGTPARELTPIGDRVFFEAASDGFGNWLWTSDATEAGTMAVWELESEMSHLMEVDGRLMFVAKHGADYALWQSDGSEAGTYRVAILPDGEEPSDLALAAGRFFLARREAATGSELWALTPATGSELLRNDFVTRLDPITPPLASIFPLDPARDGIGSLPSGALDPDAGIVADRSRPLVFYGLTASETIRLVKADALRIRVEY